MSSRYTGLHEGFSAKDISAFGLSRLRKERAAGNKSFGLDISGLDGFAELLHAMPRGPGRAIMRKALRASTNFILRHVKSVTPVLAQDKEGRIRGALKRHMRVRALRRSRKTFGYQILMPLRSQLGIKETETYFYPTVVEYGDKDTKPHSFLRRGWDEKENAAVKMLNDLIWDGIDDYSNKIRR